MTSFNLEQSARELTEAIAKGPPLSGVSLADARKAVEAAQSPPISMPDIDDSWATLSSALGDFEVRIVRPQGSTGLLPVILYMHGSGWILGSWITRDLLTRRLAVGADAGRVSGCASRWARLGRSSEQNSTRPGTREPGVPEAAAPAQTTAAD